MTAYNMLTQLKRISGVKDAVAPGAPLVHDEVPGNVCFDWYRSVDEHLERKALDGQKIPKMKLVESRTNRSFREPEAAVATLKRSEPPARHGLLPPRPPA